MRAASFTFLESESRTEDGESLGVKVPTLSMLMVGVDITAVSGTTPTLAVWLQTSDDGGTTWYDTPADLIMASSSGSTDVTATTNKRNIANDTAVVGQHVAIFKHLPSDYVRVKYDLGGTSPDYTFSVKAVGK